MSLNAWAGTVGAEVARNPSGGPYTTTPEAEARLVVRALWRRQRVRAFGTADVDAAAAELIRQRRAGVTEEQVRCDLGQARAAGVGTGVIAALAHLIGMVGLAALFVCLVGGLGLLLVFIGFNLVGLDDVTQWLFDSLPWLDAQLPAVILVYPFVGAAIHDAAQALRRFALRREYLAWASHRPGQLARGTLALPEPSLFGAGFASLPAKVLGPTMVLVGLGIAGVMLLDGDLGALFTTVLIFGALAAVLGGIAWVQGWRLRRIALLHGALAGPAAALWSTPAAASASEEQASGEGEAEGGGEDADGEVERPHAERAEDPSGERVLRGVHGNGGERPQREDEHRRGEHDHG